MTSVVFPMVSMTLFHCDIQGIDYGYLNNDSLQINGGRGWEKLTGVEYVWMYEPR